MDRDATIDKACELIDEAGRAGARLIVFPEAWVPMYPFWHATPDVFSGDLFARLWKNAVELPSYAAARLASAARAASAYVVMGINERDTTTRGTLYNTMLFMAPTGEVLHRHRKLMPTFTERTIWGMGDGSDLAVMQTPIGRLGGLICWEHEMTLVKYAMYAQGEQIHCSQWPAYTSQNDHIDFGTRQYAFEGACFVVSACGVAAGDLPSDLAAKPIKANGGSAIIAPTGKYLAGPVYDREEILYAEIDLEQAIREKHSRDVAGHYARPDVLQLIVNTQRKPVASYRAQAVDADVMSPDVADRLDVVREYLGSLMSDARSNGDHEVNEALAEALASIDMAAAGMWSRD
jgi:predicted amidohydrolase